jgi:hypothetical protein
MALAGATTLGTTTPAQAIGDRSAGRRPETIAARQKVFGAENVNPVTGLLPRDKMIASWLPNSSFALSVAGTVLYLDTYVTRLELVPGRTPFTIKDLVVPLGRDCRACQRVNVARSPQNSCRHMFFIQAE